MKSIANQYFKLCYIII